MRKSYARLIKSTLIIFILCVLVGAFVYVSLHNEGEYIPARAATSGTMLDTGNGMELGINNIRTDANTGDGGQSGSTAYDGKDIYTDGGSFVADPNSLEYTPAANNYGVYSKILFSSNYQNNNLYNAVTARGDFNTDASLFFNVSVVDAGKTATLNVVFAWSPTGSSANEMTKTYTTALDNSNTLAEFAPLSNLTNTSLSRNAYFRISIRFTNMSAPYPKIRLSGIVVQTQTVLTDTVTFDSKSVYTVSGDYRRPLMLNTKDSAIEDYKNILADTYVKTGDTISLRTKVFKNGDTSQCYQLPSVYSKVFNDGGMSGTDARFGVYWQQYSSYLSPTGELLDDTTIRYLTVNPDNSGYKLITEYNNEGVPTDVWYYQIEYKVDEGVRNAHEIIIVPQLLVKFDAMGPSCERGIVYVNQEPIRIKVDGVAPENPTLNPSTGLGYAIASNAWYTTNNTIDLSILSPSVQAQSREYIYAFVCNDPGLTSIKLTGYGTPGEPNDRYDFTPIQSNPLRYLSSTNEEQQSLNRQEVTYYAMSTPGKYTLSYRPVTFLKGEQALVLYRVDVAGNVSIPTIYYQNNNSPVKVDTSLYSVSTTFAIGKDGDAFSEELSNNPIKAANIEFFAGSAYHTADGTFLGTSTYGYSSKYTTSLKRNQWVTIRISVTVAQNSAYRLIRYKNEEAEVDYYSDSMKFTDGAAGRPDYIDITFFISDEYLLGTGVFTFYFRKCIDVGITQNSFVFDQGSTIGIEDYIESFDDSLMISNLTYSCLYYEILKYNVIPDYAGDVMQPSGKFNLGQDDTPTYTGMLSVGGTITMQDGVKLVVLRMQKQVENGNTSYDAGFYKVGSGVEGGMVDVGEYFYRVDINLTSTYLYFGWAEGYYHITKADPEVTDLRADSIVYGPSLDSLVFVSTGRDNEDLTNSIIIKGITYYKSKSGVYGSYQIVDPAPGSDAYTKPNANSRLRVEVVFNPIPLGNGSIFDQNTIQNNQGSIGEYFNNIGGIYYLKKGAYHSGNFASKTYVIYVAITNAEGDVTINGLDYEYDGLYKEIRFTTNPEADLPVTYTITLVNENNQAILDGNGNRITYTRINNAGRYRIDYKINAAACNYYNPDGEETDYITIRKRTLNLVPVDFNTMQETTYDNEEYNKYYSIKFGKVSPSTLPKPQSYIPDGDLINVGYLYSYKMVKDYSGVGTVDPQYSDYYLGTAFPQDIDAGTYLLRIKVNDANNQGEITVVTVIDQVLKSDLVQAAPRLVSGYAVYDKDNALQTYLGDSTQGHIEYGQTLASQTDAMLAGVITSAIYKLAGVNTTINGRFVFESETAIAERYNQLYDSDPLRKVVLDTNSAGDYILPVRYDPFKRKTITSYAVIIYWQAGEWVGEEFVRDNNYTSFGYEVNVCVARATAVFTSMSFDNITYGQTLKDTQLLGKPFALAVLPSGSYTLTYSEYQNIVYSKGEHLINCTFTPITLNGKDYLDNYRMLTGVKIPLTVIAKAAYIELAASDRSSVYGSNYSAPPCKVYVLKENNVREYFTSPGSMLSFTFRNGNGDIVNVATALGMTTYVSAAPGSYTLTITITSNDYEGTLVVDYTIEKGKLYLLSEPTQEIVEYGVLIGDIDFYNGQCQNTYTRQTFTGTFRLVPNPGDDTFVPQADREGYSVVRKLRFFPSDASLYNYYEVFSYVWTYRINKNSKDVSIVPKADTLNVVYDGTDKPVDFDISYPGGASEIIKAATGIKYYSLDGQIEFTKIPRDAGAYRVVIAVKGDFLNFAGTVTCTLNIAKQPITIDFAERYHVYTGESQGFGDISFNGYVGDQGAIRYAIQYYRYTGASMFEQLPSEVGKYIARITINENNFSGTADINFYIIPSSITVSNWYYVYDDSDKTVSVQIEPSLVDYVVRYRAEQRDDEGNLIGVFGEAKPRDAGRYQIRITINENGYYKEIDVFQAVETNGNLYDESSRLTIVQSSAGEYVQKVEGVAPSGKRPLFLRVAKAFAVMTITPANQNKTVTYNGSSTAIVASFTPAYLTAAYTYTPCRFEIVDGIVVPILENGTPIPLNDLSQTVFDSYGRPISVGYYVLTISLIDPDYQLGEYVKPTLKVNPAPLIIDTMPSVSGNIYYKQTTPVNFIENSGQVRFAALGITLKGRWEVTSDISNLKVGTYGNIAVRFIPLSNGVQNINYIPATGVITIAIAKKDIGGDIYFKDNGAVLPWTGGVVIRKPYTQLQISCEAWLDNAGAGIDASYNNGKPLTLRIRYNGTYTSPINVGTYKVVAEISDSNYQGLSQEATLVIERAKPAIILPDASPIPLGSTLSQSRLTSGLAYIASSVYEDKLRSIAGSFTFDSPDTVMDKANYRTVWAVFTPADLTTYDVRTFQIEVLVQGIPVSVAGVSATDLVYGQTLGESVLSYTGSTVPGTIKWVDENEIVDVGAPARYMFIPQNSDVYNIIYDGQVYINIAKADMAYDEDTLHVKGYIGEMLTDAHNNVYIDLWHSGDPSIRITDAGFEIKLNISDEEISASNKYFECDLIVSHPNYNTIEIYTTIKTYVYLGGDSFHISKTSKQYDAEPVTIEDLGIVLIGTPELLDLSLFQMKVYQNGVEVSEIRDTGTYNVVITLHDDVSEEDITMAYDGMCAFTYTVNKKVFDGSGSSLSNQIYVKGNNTVYGGAAGDVEAFFQYKKYTFIQKVFSKVYNGAPLAISDFGIALQGTEDPGFVITAISKYNTSAGVYQTVASAVAAGVYQISLSLIRNEQMGVTEAPLASVILPFTIYETAASNTAIPTAHQIALYAATDESQVKYTYYSTDKLIEYGRSAPVSSGNYIVTVTFLAANPYYEGSQDFSYVVDPMTIYVSMESAYNFEYGQNIVITPMFTASRSSSTALSNIGYTLLYSVNVGGSWIPMNETPVNAGNYRVKLVLKGTDYVLAEGEGEVRLDITQLRVVITKVPTLSNIVFGQELYNSTIFNGVAVLDKSGVAVAGKFSFKEPDKNDLPAGDRTVTIVFTPSNANYAVVETNGVPIKILKASASIECIVLSLPYNGLEQQPEIRTNPVPGLMVTFSYSQSINGQIQNVNKPRFAGNYEVEMNISDGNYTGHMKATFIITKAVIGDANVVVPTVSPQTYGQSLSYSALVGGKATNPANNSEIAGVFVFMYNGVTLLGQTVGGASGSNDPFGFKKYNPPINTISDILGTYTSVPYKFLPSDTENYEIYESTISIILMKAHASITVFDPVKKAYGNVASFVYGENIPDLTFETSPMGLTVYNKSFKDGLFNTLPNAGSYEFTAEINDSNYSGKLTYVVSVNRRKAQLEFFNEDGQITDWYSYTFASTKSPRAKIIAASLISQDLQRKEEIESGLVYKYMLRGSSSNVVLDAPPKNVGEYIVYAELENDDYYVDSAALVPNYDITKANVTYLGFNTSTLINIIYGSVQMPTVVTKPDNISYKISFPGYPSMPTTAGTHRIKVVVDDPNFYPAEKTGMFQVYQKEISIDNIKVHNRPYDGTDVVQITGELSGLVINDEVRLTMTARTEGGAKDPGVYGVEILSWTISGLHAANYKVINPKFNGTVKITQKVITDPATDSYITCEEGFSSNITVSFEKVYKAQNQSTLFSELLGQSAIVQKITIKELGLPTELTQKVKFHVLIPEKYRNSPTLQVEALGKLAEQSISFVREGDYMTFYADQSGEIIFYTHDFPYWIIVVGGCILIVIIGAFILIFLAPVRRRKRIPAKVRDTYAAIQDYGHQRAYSRTVAQTKAGRFKYGK